MLVVVVVKDKEKSAKKHKKIKNILFIGRIYLPHPVL
jgi:hypothetical protein